MQTMGVAAFTRARDRLLAVDASDLPSGEACEEIVRAFHEVARFRWCAVMTTDPETMLPSGGVVEGFSPDDCVPFWDNELVDPDFNKFTDLARSVDPVATLAETVDGDLSRSPRYTKLYADLDAADELRVAFVAGSSCLAIGVFLRPASEGPFTAEELADVRQLVPVATTTLRRELGRVLGELSTQAPVVIMLDGEGNVTGMSAGGQEVLDDLRINGIDGAFPGVIQVAATKARWSRTASNLTTRLRGRSGRWLRLHVTPMEGEVGAVALTVETARPDDLARVLLESYGLTARETEIVLRLCRGWSTKEIAAELVISSHTVRDHLKAIYEKAQVNSRGELVAGLFSNHVLDRFHETVSHVGAVG
jgi:DNA-binding CsgD family transcriptional regulator